MLSISELLEVLSPLCQCILACQKTRHNRHHQPQQSNNFPGTELLVVNVLYDGQASTVGCFGAQHFSAADALDVAVAVLGEGRPGHGQAEVWVQAPAQLAVDGDVRSRPVLHRLDCPVGVRVVHQDPRRGYSLPMCVPSHRDQFDARGSVALLRQRHHRHPGGGVEEPQHVHGDAAGEGGQERRKHLHLRHAAEPVLDKVHARQAVHLPPPHLQRRAHVPCPQVVELDRGGGPVKGKHVVTNIHLRPQRVHQVRALLLESHLCFIEGELGQHRHARVVEEGARPPAPDPETIQLLAPAQIPIRLQIASCARGPLPVEHQHHVPDGEGVLKQHAEGGAVAQAGGARGEGGAPGAALPSGPACGFQGHLLLVQSQHVVRVHHGVRGVLFHPLLHALVSILCDAAVPQLE
mmetsp:Transcript_4341/g.8186  ORF Transcript_4341/g.8186 Transcript_4341/m.8186 type:complete len:407 (+) Transcript_4341:582-1802(+)